MKSKKHLTAFVLLLSLQFVFGQYVTDPLPYAPIANPLPDTMDQLYRDSINLVFSPIRVNQAGYRPQDKKYFYYVDYTGAGAESGFSVINDANIEVGNGTLVSTGNTVSGQLSVRASNNAQLETGGDTRYIMEGNEYSGKLYEGELISLSEGKYRIVVGSDTSAEFVVDEKIYSWVRDALLKFFGVNRCGDSDSWFHPPCHIKDPLTGGWHDCGDHLKEGSTIGFAAAILGLSAAVFQDRDADAYSANHGITNITDGIPDMLYEAKHGADYILRSYELAGGNVADMILSVGDFGEDHMWWGQPEYQDGVPKPRGGPPRDGRRNHGADILGDFAGNLAFVSKVYKKIDADYSERCLEAAINIYEHAKDNLGVATSEAYHGQTTYNDDMAFAALALLWTTGERDYLDELCYDPVIGEKASAAAFPKALFEGGWFAHYDPIFYHSFANTDWGSVQVPVLWGFFRLVLNNEQLCSELGLTEEQKLALIEKTAYNMVANVASIALGTETVELPNANIWTGNTIKYELPWFTMHTQQEWVWNRYQAGNITDMYCYWDMASKIQGLELPNTPGSTDWKAQEVKTILIRQLDYMLGINPWDISMIYGVGDKNFNHPHHRAANPEGKNVPGAFYRYVPPVGALQGSYNPQNSSLYSEHYDDWEHSETGIDGTAAIFLPVAGLAKEEPMVKPSATVRILYVGCDNAIIEIRQTRYGNSTIRYSSETGEDLQKTSDSAGVLHRIELTDLTQGTEYNFDVLVSDLFGNDSVILNIDEDKRPVKFTFTTLQNCMTNAEITNVKICQVTSDSAEIFWYTPNGAFDSRVVFGESKPPSIVHDGDIAGVPVKFHFVKIGGLKEQTTYYFYVQSGETIDDNDGVYYEFTTPVERVEFDVRAIRYEWGGKPSIGFNVINHDVKSYDSIDVRIYFRAQEGFENDLGARMDIGIVYNEAGYQDEFSENSDIRENIMRQKPKKIEDTYNEADGTYAYYLSIPLWGVEMKSGSRIRMDIVFDRRSPFPPHEDLMDQPPEHEITDNDWSFGLHSRANGDPVDFPGIPFAEKNDVDHNYWNHPINYYMTVYRKGEFIWGYSPSTQEQQTKKNQYTLETLVTDPLQNPSDDYILYKRTIPSVDVSGWAKITPIDGTINNIWINGIELENSQTYVNWNEEKQRYDFTVPVPVKNGPNTVDIVFFAGPDETCVDCYGCAASTHSFFIEFTGAKQYPSSLSLRDLSMNPLTSDTARIDTTAFHIVVSDRNGNIDGQIVDTLFVNITNSVTGDSIPIMLLETGDSTNTFQTVSPVNIVSTPTQKEFNHIYMMGGDKILITYIDPTDPTDISEAFLVSKADFPVALDGYFKDENGDGKADRLIVRYNRQFDSLPDSVIVSFPDETTLHTLRKSVEPFEIVDTDMLSVTLNTGFEAGVTGFSSGGKGSGMSFLTSLGTVKMSAFEVSDSIGPVLINSVILHERTGSERDTLTVQFSEMITATSLIDNALILYSEGMEYELNVHGILNSESSSNSFTIMVTSPVEIKRNDSVKINSSGLLTDMIGNHAHSENPKVPVFIKENAPQLFSGIYKDTDANGTIDNVELKFSKNVKIEDLKLELSWENGTRKEVGSEYISYAGNEELTGVVVEINGLLTGNEIITEGRMRAFATFSGFEDHASETEVLDKAAPVIISALLSPSGETENIIDTLTVKFSESAVFSSDEPFELYSDDLSDTYSFIVQNYTDVDNKAVKFYLSEFVGIEFPSNRDSIRIDPMAGVSDMSGNSQDNPLNRRVLMDVKPLPVTVEFEGGPNPFIVDQSLININGELPVEIAGKQYGYLLKVIPLSRVKTKQEISGDVKIYDALGNYVYEKELIASSNANSSNKYFHWEGRNKKGRFVGSGTYLAVVRVQSSTGMEIKERMFIGVKR